MATKENCKGPCNWSHIIMIVLVVALVAVAFTRFDYNKTTQDRTITASGTAFKDVEPNKVEINFAVETRAKTAQEAQTQNAELINKAKQSLKDLGMADKDIETTYYSVAPEYSYDKNYQEPPKVIGYVAVHNIRVASNDVNSGGKIIDSLSSSGVNRIDSIQFGLDEKKQAEVKNELIAEASKNARTKAESLASGTRTRIRKVLSVSESSDYYPPIRYASEFMTAAADSGAKSNLSPGNIRVASTVNVVYSIK